MSTLKPPAAKPLAITYLKPSALKAASDNPRTISDKARAALKRGIEAFGLVDPIVARRQDKVVIGGHQRLQAAVELGLSTVPVVLVDVSEQQASALNVLLNNPAAQGEWDMGKLTALLATLDVDGFDATLTGFDDEELAKLLSWTPEPENGLLPGVDPDAVPEVSAEPITKLGDRIALGRHTLVCADATEVPAWDLLLGGRMAGMVWTDPPYGVSYGEKVRMMNKTGLGSQAGWSRVEAPIENDDLTPESLRDLLRTSLALALAHTREGASWYVAAPPGPLQFEFATVLRELDVWRHTLQWVKDSFVLGRSDYHYRHEPIFYGWKEGAAHTWNGGRSQDSVLEVPRPRANNLHPTMKPVALVQRCIENSSTIADLIVDPFGGSGSTLIAAEVSARSAALIELSPAYCDVIVNRWQDATGQKAVRP